MTSMKGAPAPTFNATVNQLLVKSVKETCSGFGFEVAEGQPVVRKSMPMTGDYLAGIRVSGSSFQGIVTLSMTKSMARALADKVFAGAPAKTNDSMLCDLVGEVCNQMTGVIQRSLGQVGCKMKVSAQETAQSPSTLDVGLTPEEWLLIPFSHAEGSGVLGFGIVGDLGIGQDNVQDDLSDARNITFF